MALSGPQSVSLSGDALASSRAWRILGLYSKASGYRFMWFSLGPFVPGQEVIVGRKWFQVEQLTLWLDIVKVGEHERGKLNAHKLDFQAG